MRARLEQVNPVFARLDILPRFGCSDQTGPAGDASAVGSAAFVLPITNYYQTDPISRAPDHGRMHRINNPAIAQAAE